MSDIRDVAKEAGVSIGTVSRVVNGSGPVNELTKAKVQEAVKKLGYRPHTVARSLRTGQTHIIGLVLPSLKDPFFAALASTLEEEFENRDYTINISSIGDSENASERLEDMINQRRTDGILMCTTQNNYRLLNSILTEHSTPIILLDAVRGFGNLSSISVDNSYGMNAAIEHLKSKSHTKIGYMTGCDAMCAGEDRLLAFKQAMKNNGLEVKSDWIVEADPTVPGGYDGGVKIAKMADRPTAVICFNDLMAYGLMRAAADNGISVPDGLAVVGCEDHLMSAYTTPPLSTLAYSVAEVAKAACELILSRIKTKDISTKQITIKPSLVVRKSS